MPNSNLTHITFVIDRSGSMSNLVDETIEGFNNFIEEQKKIPGDVHVSLYLFDHKYYTIYEHIALDEVPNLTRNVYYTDGGYTALVDAVGKTITTNGNYFSGLDEEQRPGKVLMVVMTDGRENYSTEFTSSRITDMVKHQQDVYSWQFIFMGCGIDALSESQGIGMGGHTVQTSRDSRSVLKGYKSLSTQASVYRVSGSLKGVNVNVDEE